MQKNFNLHDVWKIKNPEVKSFLWSQNSPFVFCRLDYWLTSAHLFDHINNADICPAIENDHSMITLEFKMIEKHLKGPSSWKLNVSLLMNEDYVSSMESNIPIWKEDSQKHFDGSKMSWEWIKFKIRKFSLDFSEKFVRKKKGKRIGIINETLKVVHELNPSDESFYKLEKNEIRVRTFRREEDSGDNCKSQGKVA